MQPSLKAMTSAKSDPLYITDGPFFDVARSRPDRFTLAMALSFALAAVGLLGAIFAAI